jgi:signal transduction histidine kinase
MAYQVTPFMWVNALVFSFTTGLAAYALLQYVRQTRRPLLLAFAGFMLSISGWELTEFLGFAVTDPGLKLLFRNVLNAVPAALFLYFLLWFALAYTENDQWVHPWVSGTAIITVVGLSVAIIISPQVFFEPLGLSTQGPLTVFGVTVEQWVVLDRRLTIWFRLYQVYAYAIHLLVVGILLRYIVRNRSTLHTGQATALLVGIVPQVVFNSLLFLGLVSPTWNLTAALFSVTAIGFAVAVFRYRLLAVAPVGRKQLVDLMSDPVVMVDSDGRVVDTNPAVRELVDIKGDWHGMSARELFAPLPGSVDRLLSPDDDHLEIELGDSTQVYDVRTSPIRAQGGGHAGQIIVFRDITDQKTYQRELEEATQQLEQQNEKLDQFVGIVSHDLRNPLSIVRGRLDLLRETGDHDHLDPLDRNVERMETMIEELLSLSRAGRSTGEREAVSLAAVAADSWSTVDHGDASLEVEIAESVTVEANRARLQQLFENLYRNAREHNDSAVSIRVGSLDSEGGPSGDAGATAAGFFIADDGGGISPGEHEKVFEHGYTTNAGGTGFGLSIVEEIVDAHDWSISVTDSRSGGARFEVRTMDPS